MARIGLGASWACRFAHDDDEPRAQAYRENFGAQDFRLADVWDLTAADLPGRADLVWTSSPCQDLGLAGARGLQDQRSAAFWGFWRLIEQLDGEGRAPRAVGVEHALGLLTSHGGADFNALCAALADRGYGFGALEIDAALFLPQARPRLFLLAVRSPGRDVLAGGPGGFHTPAILRAFERLPPGLKDRWLWWRVPPPARCNAALADVLEPDDAVPWLSPARAARLVSLMADVHKTKLDLALQPGGRAIGAAFRRTWTEAGRRMQRTEARFDGLAGRLRASTGGSSRQFVLVAEDGKLRARFLAPREAARLMGLPEDYRLPIAARAALRLAGDGVAAPVVRHLAAHVLEPLLAGAAKAAA